MPTTPKEFLVIDGGFGTQLTQHVGERIDGDPLWSARFNATNPNAVLNTHLDFLRNGAGAIRTNTYQASIEGYMEFLQLDEKESIELIKKTVGIAHEARTQFLADRRGVIIDRKPLVVASIGPYGAHLRNGSEYTGSYADKVDDEIIKKWHRVRIDACIEAGVDALAVETIPCQMEALALIDLLCEEHPDIKFWLSFQCKDSTSLANGENFAEVAQNAYDKIKNCGILHNLIAIGVNCVNPRFVTPLFTAVNGNRSEQDRIPLIVYPNSGEVYDVEEGWTGKADCVPLENYVPEWIELGVVVFGGCCRTFAPNIQRIKDAVLALSDDN